ncbi:AraC family transcriptional regulator [Fimbriimonas ginsengisoli]|nr:GyrI-like domain-containing protein [Fimbriimonas ginsengisoli]
MNVQVIQLAPIHVVLIRHRGPYDELGGEFDRLWEWVTAQRVSALRTIGIYWDNPDFVPASKLRSAACVEVPAGFQIGNSGGLPLEVDDIAGGEYATTRFVGPYEDLAPVWSDLTRYVEGTLRRKISDNPAFEVYVNDASDTPPEQLITELYMPLR